MPRRLRDRPWFVVRERQVKTRDLSMVHIPGARRRAVLGWVVEGAGLGALAVIVSLSAIVTKEMQSRGSLAALVAMNAPVAVAAGEVAPVAFAADPLNAVAVEEPAPVEAEAEAEAEVVVEEIAAAAPAVEADLVGAVPAGMENDPNLRWFNGRPVRPVRTMWMKVTAYSPDHRSCGKWADGITASLHSVFANNMKLVAADSRILPLGSMITVPGYGDDDIVPVLDRGGAIKGHRLDVLYPTHEIARKWGVKRLKVTVWEYADGEPAGNWRKIRDSKK